jgi:hypothetical protein
VDARPDGYYGYVDWPSARVYGCSWIDKQRNHLYLYGGAIQSGSVNSDMWVFDLSQPSLGWKRVGPSNGQRVHQGRLSFSSNSKLVWPGVRVHPICWQQADPASGEELFFMMGGLTRASVTSSDSYQIFYSSDVFAFKPSSKTWAYVLGSYGDIDVDRANAQPSVGVMQRSALSWTSNSLRLYVHSNPIFNKDSVLDMLPLTLDPIAQAEWWDYDIYPFATSGGASVPRPVTGAWVWRHPENGAYIMDGRLPYDHPQYGAELWRQSKDSSSADCFSLRP